MARRKRSKEDAEGRHTGPLGTVPETDWPKYAAAFAAMCGTERERQSKTAEYPVMYYADLRIRALASFWVFLSEVLEIPVLYEPLHRPLADWLEPRNWKKQKKMLLLHRGGVKSNAFNIGYALWRLCRNHNERVLIASHKDEDAAKFVSAAGDIVTGHEKFRNTFPDVRPKMRDNGTPERWSQWQILIERDKNYVEPSIQGCSQRTSATGRHYSLLIPDDLVTDKNTSSPLELGNTENFHRLCESLLDPGAQELMLGTRYHFADEYGRIIDTPSIERLYDIKVIPVIEDPRVVDEYIDGTRDWKRQDDYDLLAFPSRFTLDPRGDYISPDGDETKHRKSVPQIKALQGSLIFANQYLLEPRDPGSQVFDATKIEVLERLPYPPEGREMEFYQFLDHASEKQTQSCTALVTVAIGPRFTMYIVDVFWGTYSNAQVADEMIRWQQMPQAVRPRLVGLGRSAYELNLEQYCRERCKELQVSIPFQFVKPIENQEEKNDHIKRLTPFFDAGKIKILKNCRNRAQIISEFDWFPKGKSKDCIDALAHVTKIVLPGRERDFLDIKPVAERPQKKAGVTFNDVLEEMQRGGKVRIGGHQIMRRQPSTGKVRMR